MVYQCPKCFELLDTQEEYAQHLGEHYGREPERLSASRVQYYTEKTPEPTKEDLRRIYGGSVEHVLDVNQNLRAKKHGWSKAEKLGYMSLLV